MSRTIRVLWPHCQTGWFNYNWGGVINENSVVHISASEFDPQIPPNVISPDIFLGKKIGESRIRGAATIYVKNVRPHKSGGGGVEFFLQVDWGTPLRVVTDISVLDPPEAADNVGLSSRQDLPKDI